MSATTNIIETPSAPPAPGDRAVAAGTNAAPASLDDLMMAMDVVDTLRHNQALVEQELSQSDRDSALKAKLRELYKSQGLEVPDHVIEEGIKALAESRFVYTPPKPSFQTSLARLWIARRKITLWVAGIVGAIALGWAGYQFLIVGPQRAAIQRAQIELSETLPRLLETAHLAVQAEALEADTKRIADAYLADGRVAARGGNAEGARAALKKLTDLEAELRLVYTVRIVPSGQSAVWRIPDVNESAKNFYLLVRAVSPDGKLVPLPITSEETGQTRMVEIWGVRVTEDLFEAVRQDKRDDGIIQTNIVAEKKRGIVKAEPQMPLLGGTITEW